jgi:hypothetical protein
VIVLPIDFHCLSLPNLQIVTACVRLTSLQVAMQPLINIVFRLYITDETNDSDVTFEPLHVILFVVG